MQPIAIYKPCAACAGHGRAASNGVRIILCEICKGAGFVPSEDGKVIIDLLKAAGMEELMPEW